MYWKHELVNIKGWNCPLHLRLVLNPRHCFRGSFQHHTKVWLKCSMKRVSVPGKPHCWVLGVGGGDLHSCQRNRRYMWLPLPQRDMFPLLLVLEGVATGSPCCGVPMATCSFNSALYSDVRDFEIFGLNDTNIVQYLCNLILLTPIKGNIGTFFTCLLSLFLSLSFSVVLFSY